VRGGWRAGPEERHHLFMVDVSESPKSSEFFRIYRALLEARFGQAEIYVRSYRVSGVRRFGQLA